MALQVRKHPVHGINHKPDRTTVIFLTVCTDGHGYWLADEKMHCILHEIWLKATFWLVGPYLLMPDHMHLFAIPGKLDYSFERWSAYWKREFSIRMKAEGFCFQTDQWDTRMRNGRHFTEKWDYVQNNPVRKGLVEKPEDWPYKGLVHEWTYMGP